VIAHCAIDDEAVRGICRFDIEIAGQHQRQTAGEGDSGLGGQCGVYCHDLRLQGALAKGW